MWRCGCGHDQPRGLSVCPWCWWRRPSPSLGQQVAAGLGMLGALVLALLAFLGGLWGGKRTQVRPYTKKNGVRVRTHTRRMSRGGRWM